MVSTIAHMKGKIRAPDPQGNIRILHWADPYEHEIVPRVMGNGKETGSYYFGSRV